MSTEARPAPEELLQAARAGDMEALGTLLQGYRNYLLLLSRLQLDQRLTGKVDPTDVVQDTFLEAYRDFAQFRGTTEGELVRWLRQVLVTNLANLIRHYLGTQCRNVRLERELEAELEHSSACLGRALAAPHSSPSERAARREEAVLLADALQQLPEHYREVLILRNLQGLPFGEVAQRMGRSVDSVEKLWVRALAQLRKRMEGGNEQL